MKVKINNKTYTVAELKNGRLSQNGRAGYLYP